MATFAQQHRPVFPSSAQVGLFFAIFPPASAAAEIARIARHCRREYGFDSRPLATSRFHVSLQHLGEYDEVPEEVVRNASAAAATVAMGSFAVMFDGVGSFSGREGNHPLVLRGDDGVVGLAMLHRALGAAMRQTGLKARLDVTPHLTLLYDNHRIDQQFIEPIRWTVNEFVLVQSLIGRTKYILLDRWRLPG